MTPPKQNNSTRNNNGHLDKHVWFAGFIVEALQSEAPEAVAHKPVVGKTQHKGEPTRHIDEMIGSVRASLRSMGDGDISFSPYDTAWIALVKKLDGGEGPQFPSLEGIPDLDWLKLQSPGGSFMSSAASTAYALIQTGNKKCLEYLTDIVDKFNGGAPFAYPVELFERLWVVDRLERLGLSSYFRSEIDSCLDYAYRHWSDEGIGFTWDDMVRDVDDTAMGFRLLRQHGYHVSTGALKRFETKDGEFVVYPGQSSQSVTAMYNLYRAADQAAFPDDDDVVQRAKAYSYAFLRERRASGDLNDKLIISSGLPSEVAYGLNFPWKANLPRVETRMYLEQYGGGDNVWIGKVLYRMHLFNNDLFLKLAKADFSNFQRQCRLE
ncbi:syn-copalyl diphosphate synthase-like [Panicum miliaceum]|uniref:Syn-copalyl diphosphate synthase-like n=1 Tax=Panicum miliaceum TaxID=4540 RepID=A0A3L6RR01_PANMI|nr:syn-copalyl diphosphate synthase-like [Panicum miliaceum]